MRWRSASTFGFLVVALGIMATAWPAGAVAVRAGFDTTSDGRNDDGTATAPFPPGCSNPSSGGTCAGTAQPLGFTANFFGLSFTTAFLNTNGNITFDATLSTFTPFDLTSTSRQIIAPFFADVDTRAAGNPMKFGGGTVGGHTAFGVSWRDVDYFNGSTSPTHRYTFQLVLSDPSDTGAGKFDTAF